MTFTLLGLIKCSNSPLDRPIFFTSGSRFNINAGSRRNVTFPYLYPVHSESVPMVECAEKWGDFITGT